MIPHNLPTLGVEEEHAALQVLRSGWIAQGPEVENFENDFCDFLQIPHGHAVAVSSGTAAIYLSLSVLNSKNLPVSIPTYSCSILQSIITSTGSRNVLLDSQYESVNVELENISSSTTPISIIPHMYGIPINFSKIKNKIIIEDCCQALGAKINNKFVGLFGNVGIFSFHATKLMTSGGQGGMIISKNKKLINKIKNLREYGKQDNEIRLNFQMTDIQAAIGREQLKKLPSFLKRRSEIFDMYKDAGIPLLDIPKSEKNLLPVRFRAIMRTKQPKKVVKILAANGIRSTILLGSSDLLGISKNFPNAVQISNETVSLPIFPLLSNTNVKKIIKIIKSNNLL